LISVLFEVIMVAQQSLCVVTAFRARVRRDRYEGKGASAMTGTPTDDLPGFVAEEPEHCDDCYWLIGPGQRYFLTIEQAVVCPDCVGAADAIRLAGGLMVEVGEDRLLLKRGSAAVEVLPHEVRHLVDALVEAAVRLVDRQRREGEGCGRAS
jgi:hypothetical protein